MKLTWPKSNGLLAPYYVDEIYVREEYIAMLQAIIDRVERRTQPEPSPYPPSGGMAFDGEGSPKTAGLMHPPNPFYGRSTMFPPKRDVGAIICGSPGIGI